MLYHFGGFTLDDAGQELRRGGEIIALEPKGFQVLCYLLQHRDRVVSRDELFAQCWPDTYVSDWALTRCVARIRKAAGDGRNGLHLIKTVRGRGYRFVAPLTAALQDAAPLPELSAALTQLLPPSELSPSLHPLPRNPTAAERRILTILCCALVDPHARHRDPEEVQNIVRDYHTVCAEVIQEMEGYVAQYLQDEVVAYFGVPQAHDDDAQRSIRTGMRLHNALRARGAAWATGPMAVRVGIHTGLAVVGEGEPDRPGLLAVGETPLLAARLTALATPGTVVISAATARLVEGYFTWQAWKVPDSSGVEVAQGVYQVLGESGAQSRFEVAIQRGLIPLVGRQAELSLLRTRWAEATDGLGQVVLVTGEPGIGKSRLVRGLHEHLAAEPHIVVEWRCLPYAQQSPLHPVVAHLHRVLQWRPEDPPEAKLRMLEETLVAYGFALPEMVPLLAALLALPLPERYPPLTLAPQRQREKTLEALLAWLLAEANQQPVLFIVEDLHWSDPSTLEFLTLLLDRGPTARLLTLLTCRPEFAVPWGFRAHLSSLTLNRLSQPQVAQMIVHVAGGKALPSEVITQIVAKSDGVPLFVEELTKTMLESGLLRECGTHYELTGPLSPLAIPATLHDSLMARLDRLTTVKVVAQLGATIGRTFAYDLLQAVAPLDAVTLQQGLRQLVQVELVYQHGVPPRATYTFKHALIQDAAYQSLLHSTRQQYHQRIAQVLEAQFPDIVETQPELLAQHYTEAGLHEQAIASWQRAGRQALQRSAHAEAIAHLNQGLALLTTLPITAERLQHELELYTALGPALMVTMGPAAPEVAQVYTRAHELCQQVGDTPQLFAVLWGLWRFYAQCGKLHTGRELGAEFLRRAQRVPDPILLLQAHHLLGNTLFLVGELERARAHLEEGIALYHPQQHRTHVLLYGGHDPGVCCQSYAAYVAWVLGYPDQALQWGHAALILAQELSHPFSLTLVLQQVAVLDQFLRRESAAQERAEACMTVAADQGFSEWFAIGTILRGWALAMQRQEAEGITQIRQGLKALEAKGGELHRPYWLALLAEAYHTVGQHEAGYSVLAEALAVVDKTDERFYEAELYRLKGELTLHVEEAETCFEQALTIARRQRAKSWELRAATSLAQLWQRQGKCAEAYELLAPVYDWFTEGFDTADLQEAKALLEALAD